MSAKPHSHRRVRRSPINAIANVPGATALATLAAFAAIGSSTAPSHADVQPAAFVEPIAAAPAQLPLPPIPTVGTNLDGWIRQAMTVMAVNDIPGSYDGIYRNIMRESTGNPRAINRWDSNARAGIPSKGLLQVIDPTFARYHVSGTSFDIYDPVANIAAACNYAAHRYGSMDNVYSAY